MHDYFHNLIHNKKFISLIILFFVFIFSLEFYYFININSVQHETEDVLSNTTKDSKENLILENKNLLDELSVKDKVPNSPDIIKKNLEILESFNKK